MKRTTKADPNFYKFPKPIEGTIVAILMVVFFFSLWAPENVVLDFVGPLGTLARYLNKNHYDILLIILKAAVAIHAGEAVYAGYLCRMKGISMAMTVVWVLQTFLVGFPSLLQIVGYKPGRKNN